MTEDFNPARALVAAGVLIRDEAGRVLLVKPAYKDGWDIPGGYVEPGESPRQAATREVREELGITLDLGRLQVVDWAPHPDDGDKILFVFDGGILTTPAESLVLQDSELAAARFVDPSDFAELLPERLRNRIKCALQSPPDPYLESGRRR